MSGYDDFLQYGDKIEVPFSAIPHWLLPKVSATAYQLYRHIARRSGPDGWCWFTRADFEEHVRPVAKDTFKKALQELEDVGAMVVFWRWRTTGDQKGRNGGFAFFRGQTLTEDSLAGPLDVVVPTRVHGVLTPRRDDVTCRRMGSDVVRTSADRSAPKTSLATPARAPKTSFDTDQGPVSLPTEEEPRNKNPFVEQEPAEKPVRGQSVA